MESEQQRAKELFTFYRGSTFQMYREGAHDEYKTFAVSKETEMKWVQEMIDQFSGELSIRDAKALNSLESIARDFKEVSVLKNVVSFASRHIKSGDSIVKLLFAESIIRILTSVRVSLPKSYLYETLQTTKLILDDIMLNQLILDPGHELKSYNLKDKKSLNLRANKSIEELKGFLT